jgi:hypothetical protein
MDAIRIGPAGPRDAGELLTPQRAAFVTEAQLYGEPRLPALTQTLDDLRAELARAAISPLSEPRHVEATPPAGTERSALFTGDRSQGNLRLYRRLGYVEVRREEVRPGLSVVHLEKPHRPSPT